MDTDHSLTSSTERQSSTMDRRDFLKTVGATGTVAVGASGVGPMSPVGDSEAFLPAAAAVVAGVGVAGALGAFVESKYDILGSDAPPDSLGPEAVVDQIIKTAKTRQSTNESTLIDNKNLVSYVQEPAFTEGKIEAVKALNNDTTKAEVQTAAEAGVNKHISRVEKNFLNSWSESVSEAVSSYNAAVSAGVAGDVLPYPDGNSVPPELSKQTKTATLSDGTSLDIQELKLYWGGEYTNPNIWTPLNVSEPDWSYGLSDGPLYQGPNGSPPAQQYRSAVNWKGNNGEYVTILDQSKWSSVWSELQQVQTDAISNISLWVDTAYDQLQSGQLQADNLLSPTDLADQYAGENSRAIADLQALNIPNAGDNEAVIKVSDNYSSRMTGLLASSDGTVSNLSAGDTVDPSTSSADWYMSHDLGKWTATVTRYYDSTYGIQGGEIRATRNPRYHYGQPSKGVSHIVETSKGETAEIPTSDFTEKMDENNNPYWSTNIAGKLSQSTTDIAKVIAVTTGEQSGVYRTEQLTDPFEIVETSDGELSFDPAREPQTDSNYLTQEEWDNLESNTKENISAYEASQSENILGSNPLGGSGLPTLPGLGLAQSIVVVVLGALGISILTD